MKPIMGLALLLAVLSYRQAGQWESEPVLWSNAADVAPAVPRPLVNLAHIAMDQRNDKDGERLLAVADAQRPTRPAAEQAWTVDLVNANLALIRLRQHRLAEARILVNGAPYESARWQVCHAVKAICDS